MQFTGNIRPLGKKVLVHSMDRGERKTKAGIILKDDDASVEGIRNRWCQVIAIGPDVHPDDIKPGDYICVQHGRWTRGFELVSPDGSTTAYMVDYQDGVLLVADEKPYDI